MANCTKGATFKSSNTTGECICLAGYYGKNCENVRDWWFPILYTLHTVESLVLLLVMIWALVGIVSKIRTQKFVTLSGIATTLNFLGALVRFSWLVFPGNELVPFIIMTGPLFIADGVLVVTTIVLWMSASIISVVYWYEGWRNSLKYSNPKVTKITKIVLIAVMVALLILGLVGILYIRTITPYGNYVYLAPLIALTLTLIGMTILISRSIQVEQLPEKFILLHKWEMRMFISLCIPWTIYCITLPNYRNLYDPAIILALVIFRFCEISISVILMMIVDYRVITLRRIIFCQPDLDDSKSYGSSKSSQSAGSKPSTDFVITGTSSTETIAV